MGIMKKLLILVVAVILLAATLSFQSQGRTLQPILGEQVQAGIKVVTTSIDFGSGTKITGQVKAETAYDALVELAKKNDLPVETKDYSFGTLVTKIGSVSNTSEKAWLYFVNGKAAAVAGDKYNLGENDTIEWRYDKINQ